VGETGGGKQKDRCQGRETGFGTRDTGHDQEKEGWFGRLAACYHHRPRRERGYGKGIC
jgi:hypothetical protein